jgi:hypothetical protein
MEPYKTHPLITLNYYTTTLTNIDNTTIIQQIQQHGHPPHTQNIPTTGTNSHSYHEDTILPDSNETRQLEQTIINTINQITNNTYKIDAIWALTLQQNQAVMAHTHKNNQHNDHNEHWSIAYYPQAPQKSADLILHTTHSNTIDQTTRITPHTGLLVIFPSYTLHYTDRHTCEQPRTVISANLNPTHPNTKNNADWTPYQNRPTIPNQKPELHKKIAQQNKVK